MARARGLQGLTLGTTLATGFVLFAGLGYYLDQRRGGGIGWTLAGMAMGAFVGGYEIWKFVRDWDSDSTDDASARKPSSGEGQGKPP